METANQGNLLHSMGTSGRAETTPYESLHKLSMYIKISATGWIIKILEGEFRANLKVLSDLRS